MRQRDIKMNRYERYKDSGIPWLGEVPEYWEVKRLKFLTNKIVDGAHFTPTYVNEGVPFLRVTDIQEKNIDMENIISRSKNIKRT